MINIYSKIFVAGHKGMVGSSILRILKKKGYKNLITIDKKRLDLRDQKSVKEFLKRILVTKVKIISSLSPFDICLD